MTKQDKITIKDAGGRREFLRTGAAFLLVGSTAAQAQDNQQFRTDCDSLGGGGPKNAEQPGSDSDSGDTADRPGCGRRLPLTQYEDSTRPPLSIGKIAG